MQTVFSVNPSAQTRSRKRTRANGGPSPADPFKQQCLKWESVSGTASSGHSVPSLEDLRAQTGHSMSILFERVAERELQVKMEVVKVIKELREENQKLISDAQAQEKTSETLRQLIDSTKSELVQLEVSANAKDQEAQAARALLEQELNNLKKAFEETRTALEKEMEDRETACEQWTSDNNQLKAEIFGLWDRLFQANAELTAEQRKYQELETKAIELDAHWNGFHRTFSEALAVSKHESIFSPPGQNL
ncbi:hypothetical protein FB451DRAFT_1472321 [Mycena latifolia]|nr:hypothetical protein FB451DRAFT_1472321 [Mycena latifolia]